MKKLAKLASHNFKLPYVYIGEVVDIDDPKKRNRVRSKIIGIVPDNTKPSECPWVEQAGSVFSGDAQTVGISSVPEIGSFIYIQFINGDPSHPVYIGIVRGDEDSSKLQKADDLSGTIYDTRNSSKIGPELSPLNDQSSYPHNNVIETIGGNIIELDDTEGNERIAIEHHTGSYMEIRPDGTVQIKSIKDFYKIIKAAVEEYIEGNLNSEIKGNKTSSVGGNDETSVTGTFSVTASNIYLN